MAAILLLQSIAHANNAPVEIVRQYFSNLKSGNFSALMDLFDDEVVWHQPGSNILSGTYQGKEAIIALFKNFMEISNQTFRIDEVSAIMANGDLVVANVRFSAHLCTYIEAGISMGGVDLMKVIDGKIKEVYLFSEDQEAEDSYWGHK